MNLKQLEAFVKVTESGSFSKAAKLLFLTQPTVSAHISALEKELDSRLFVRNTKEVKLSEEGKQLYQYARQMVELEEEIEHVFSKDAQREEKCITIATSTIPAQYVLPAILAKFREAYKEVKEALDEMGIDLNVVEDQEPDAALGNGGLGRLAACFLDSLASLGYAAYGCGIRYRYGMFKQKIKDGYQVEVPDNWLKDGNPFEIRRDEYAKEVRFGGTIRVQYNEETKKNNFIQENYESVLAIPYDMPIVGYGNHVVNTLRIWDAQAITDFKLDAFDRGEYHKAIEQENLAKTIVEVLYPNDNHYAGKELRLKQQYFFVSASLQVMLRFL